LTSLNVLDLTELLKRHLRRILAWGAVFAVAGILISYLIPPVYKASASILPPDDDELTASLSIARRGIGGLPGLGKFGSYFTQADVALAILRSRAVHEALVKEFDLQRVYKEKNLEDAIRDLRANAVIKIATDGTIGITVSDREPKRAASLANGFLAQLDIYNQRFRASRGRRTREFLERRVAGSDSLLRESERGLAAYQRSKGSVVLPPEARGGIDAAAGLMAEKIRAEMELEILRSYATTSSEEVQRLEQRVGELRRQIGDMPATQVGGAELLRRVAIQQQVLGVLTSQLEEARIREVMDTPTIQVLDVARPPEHRAWPRRSLIAALGLVFGLGLGIADASGRFRFPGRRTP
jgi:uncharacterized protein involved in exopolysaccharide biosynthesis